MVAVLPCVNVDATSHAAQEGRVSTEATWRDEGNRNKERRGKALDNERTM